MAKIYSGTNLKTKSSFLSRDKKRLIFYILMLALPVIQFCIFYIYVNFQSISMAFMSFESEIFAEGKFVWFDNFKKVFEILKYKKVDINGEIMTNNIKLVTNSLLLASMMLFVGLPLAIFFSFYIYKRRMGHKFFKVILFLPQIISGVVFALLITQFFGGIEKLMIRNDPSAATINPFANSELPANIRMMALILFAVWMSFGVNVLLFSGAMANINPSLIEASELDGCNILQEFAHVVIPSIFPTIVSFIIVTVSGIFVNQMYLMEFNVADGFYTIGYYLFFQASQSKLGEPVGYGELAGLTDYQLTDIQPFPVLSAMSLLITLVLLPTTLIIKKLLNKFGPKTR